MRVTAVLALVALLAAATARAEPVSGEGALAVGMTLPSGSLLSSAALRAFYLADASSLEHLELRAATLRVHLYDVRFEQVATPSAVFAVPLERQQATYDLHDVTIELERTPEGGWVGVYPRGADATLELAGRSELRPRETRRIGNAPEPEPQPDPERYVYSVEVDGPNLAIADTSMLTQVGALALKLEGPDLRVVARENTTVINTGVDGTSSDPVGERRERWAFLESPHATLRLSAQGEADIALGTTDAEVDGLVIVAPGEGTLETPTGLYPLHDGGAFEGRFTLRIVPSISGGSAILATAVDGDLRSTSVEAMRLAAPAAGPAVPAVGTLLLAAFVSCAGIAGAALLNRRSTRRTVEELSMLAREASDEGRHADALARTRDARRLAPSSAALASDEAFHLGELGEVDAALATYQEALALGGSGEAALEAAHLLLATGGRALDARVLPLLLVALERTPSLVVEMEGLAPALFGDARLRDAMDAAALRIRDQ